MFSFLFSKKKIIFSESLIAVLENGYVQVRLRAVDTEMFLDLLIFRREKKFKENIWLNVLYHTQ